MIKVLFFAGLREAAQTDSIEVDPDSISNVDQLVVKLESLLPDALSHALSGKTAMVSVNHQYAGWQARLQDGDEVGFLPPVSGG